MVLGTDELLSATSGIDEKILLSSPPGLPNLLQQEGRIRSYRTG